MDPSGTTLVVVGLWFIQRNYHEVGL